MNSRSRYYLAVVVMSLALTAGCSQGGLKTVPVYGKVSFADRQAPPTCDIVFQPVQIDGPKRPSFADCESDGRYRVKAFKNSSGLVPGKYHVQLVFHDLKQGADPKKESSWNLTNYDGGEVNVDATSGGVEYNIEVRKKS